MTRLEQCLAKVYRYAEGVMTLGEYLNLHPPTAKRRFTRDRYARKTHLCYPNLVKPVEEHVLFRDEDVCMLVPKIVYDSFDVQIRSSENLDRKV